MIDNMPEELWAGMATDGSTAWAKTGFTPSLYGEVWAKGMQPVKYTRAVSQPADMDKVREALRAACRFIVECDQDFPELHEWEALIDQQKPATPEMTEEWLESLQLAIRRHHLFMAGWSKKAIAEEEAERGENMTYGYQYGGEKAVDEAVNYLAAHGYLVIKAVK